MQRSPFREGYVEAERVEMETHRVNGTWKLVPRSGVPSGVKIMPTRWVYDDKTEIGPGGELYISRFKARLTAMGNFQKPGVDFSDTFASVMRGQTFRILLTIRLLHPEHRMEKWDAKAAFINAPLDDKDEIYIEQPSGHVEPGKEHMVGRLVKALYGLHQASMVWQKYLRGHFLKAGFRPYYKDESVYYRWTEDGGGFCIVGTHVDDMVPLYNKKGRTLRDQLWEALSKGMRLVDEGDATWVLKTQILHDPKRGVTKITQASYTEEVLRLFDFRGAKPADTPTYDQGPMAEMTEADLPKTPEEAASVGKTRPFRELLGCLWWLATISRVDILPAVQKASRYISRPSEKLWKWMTKVLRYLVGTVNRGLVYTRPAWLVQLQDSPLRFGGKGRLVTGAADASFADASGMRSTLGYCLYVLGNLVDCNTKCSTRVLSSSTEAECMALVLCSKANAWLRDFLDEIGIFGPMTKPTLVKEDNTSAVALANRGSAKRSRHFAISFYKLKDDIEHGEMELVTTPTDQNEADMFTKSLGQQKFVRFRDQIMGDNDLQMSVDSLPTKVKQTNIDAKPLVCLVAVSSTLEGRDFISAGSGQVGSEGGNDEVSPIAIRNDPADPGVTQADPGVGTAGPTDSGVTQAGPGVGTVDPGVAQVLQADPSVARVLAQVLQADPDVAQVLRPEGGDEGMVTMIAQSHPGEGGIKGNVPAIAQVNPGLDQLTHSIKVLVQRYLESEEGTGVPEEVENEVQVEAPSTMVRSLKREYFQVLELNYSKEAFLDRFSWDDTARAGFRNWPCTNLPPYLVVVRANFHLRGIVITKFKKWIGSFERGIQNSWKILFLEANRDDVGVETFANPVLRGTKDWQDGLEWRSTGRENLFVWDFEKVLITCTYPHQQMIRHEFSLESSVYGLTQRQLDETGLFGDSTGSSLTMVNSGQQEKRVGPDVGQSERAGQGRQPIPEVTRANPRDPECIQAVSETDDQGRGSKGIEEGMPVCGTDYGEVTLDGAFEVVSDGFTSGKNGQLRADITQLVAIAGYTHPGSLVIVTKKAVGSNGPPTGHLPMCETMFSTNAGDLMSFGLAMEKDGCLVHRRSSLKVVTLKGAAAAKMIKQLEKRDTRTCRCGSYAKKLVNHYKLKCNTTLEGQPWPMWQMLVTEDQMEIIKEFRLSVEEHKSICVSQKYNFIVPPGTMKDSETFKEILERMANESESELGSVDIVMEDDGPAEVAPGRGTSSSGSYKKRRRSDVEEGEKEREEQTLIEQVKSKSKLEYDNQTRRLIAKFQGFISFRDLDIQEYERAVLGLHFAEKHPSGFKFPAGNKMVEVSEWYTKEEVKRGDEAYLTLVNDLQWSIEAGPEWKEMSHFYSKEIPMSVRKGIDALLHWKMEGSVDLKTLELECEVYRKRIGEMYQCLQAKCQKGFAHSMVEWKVKKAYMDHRQSLLRFMGLLRVVGERQ